MTTIQLEKTVDMPTTFRDDLHLFKRMLGQYSSFEIEDLAAEERKNIAMRSENMRNLENQIFASVEKIK